MTFDYQKNYRLISIFTTLVIVFFLALYVKERPWFHRTSDMVSLAKFSALFAVLLGTLMGYLLRKNGKDLTEKIQIGIFFIVIFVFFSPLVGSLTNRLFSQKRTEQVEIHKIEGRLSQPYGLLKGEKPTPNLFVVFYIKEGILYDFKTRNPDYLKYKDGDKVLFDFKKGLWGYEVLATSE